METYKNILANKFMRDTNYIIIKDTDDLEELERQWELFNSQLTVRQQRLSDDRSIEIWNMTNKEHYEDLKIKLMKDINPKPIDSDDENNDISYDTEDEENDEDIQDEEITNLINMDLDDFEIPDDENDITESIKEDSVIPIENKDIEALEPKSYHSFLMSNQDIQKDNIADQYEIDTNMHIVGRVTGKDVDDYLSNLEKSFIDFNAQTHDHRRKSDDKCREIYGMSNIERYNKLKANALNLKLVKSTDNKTLDSSKVQQLGEFVSQVYDNMQAVNEVEQLKVNKHRRFNDTPYFTPTELIDMGVHGNHNFYSKDADNDGLITNVKVATWFDSYKDMCMDHIFEDYRKDWIDTLDMLYSDFEDIKASGNEEKILARKQSILDLGWNPEIPFNRKNRLKASERVSKILDETIPRDIFINLNDIPEPEEDDIIEEQITKKTHQPVFLIFTQGKTPIISSGIKFVTHSDYSHASISFDPELNEVYSFNMGAPGENGSGFVRENLKYFKDNVISVMAFFAPNKVIDNLKEKINSFKDNKTTYDFGIILNKLLHIDRRVSNNEYNQVCSTFVDSVLKSNGINLTGDIEIPDPGQLYNASKSTPNKIIEIFNDVATKYNGKSIKKKLNALYNKKYVSIEESISNVRRTVGRKITNMDVQINKARDTVFNISDKEVKNINKKKSGALIAGIAIGLSSPILSIPSVIAIKKWDKIIDLRRKKIALNVKERRRINSDANFATNLSKHGIISAVVSATVGKIIDKIMEAIDKDRNKYPTPEPSIGYTEDDKPVLLRYYENRVLPIEVYAKLKEDGKSDKEIDSIIFSPYNLKPYFGKSLPKNHIIYQVAYCNDKYNTILVVEDLDRVKKYLDEQDESLNNYLEKNKSYKFVIDDKYCTIPDNHKIYALKETTLPTGVTLRNATKDDTDNMFKWKMESVDKSIRNDPKTIKYINDDVQKSIKDTKMIMYKNETIGMFTTCILNGYWYIEEIYIVKEHRNKGIGTALLKDEISKHDKIKLKVAQSNHGAMKLYKSLGFEITDRNDEGKLYIMTLDKKEKPINEVLGDIVNGVNPYSTKTFYHISFDSNLDDTVMKPRIPTWIADKIKKDKDFTKKLDELKTSKEDGTTGYEEYTTPRVCLSNSIEGCLNAIINDYGKLTLHDKTLYVYTPEKPISEYKHKTNKQILKDGDIFDANTTNEMWILEPVKMKYVGSIVVDKITGEQKKKFANNKNKTNIQYKYKWHWFHKVKYRYDNEKNKFVKEQVSILNEVKRFPIEFDKEGNLIIYKARVGSLAFGDEIDDSVQLLQAYRNASNIEGIKYELAKLWYINDCIEKKLKKRLSNEQYKELIDTRATCLNIFKTNLDYVMKAEKGFNFSDYYNSTPFSDNSTKITANTLKYAVKTVTNMI